MALSSQSKQRAVGSQAKKNCEQIKLGEDATSHVGTFKYLGSVISEKGGMGADIKSRITQSRPRYSPYSHMGVRRVTILTRTSTRWPAS